MSYLEAKWVIHSYWILTKASDTTLTFEGKYRIIQYVTKDCMRRVNA